MMKLRIHHLILAAAALTASLYGEMAVAEPPMVRVPLTYEAVLEPETRTLITTDLNAKVMHVFKHMGDRFHKGDLLLQLDREVVKALQLKAEAALERARITYETKKTLLHDGIASYNEYADAKAALATARAELTIAKRNLRNTSIVAPYDGRMVNVNVQEGEYPNQELHLKFKPLLEIVNDRILLAKILVPARLMAQLRRGQTISIVINETGETIQATLKRIGAVIDPISSTILIDATVDNADGHLVGGMTGRASLEINPDLQDEP